MKKLELKNLKVKALSKDEKSKINGGIQYETSKPCNKYSVWPVECLFNPWQSIKFING